MALCTSENVLGKVGEETYPSYVKVLSRLPIPLGTYVTIPFEAADVISGGLKRHCAVGVVSSTSYRKLIPTSPSTVALTSSPIGIEEEALRYSSSIVRIIADVCEGEVRAPTVPPPPDLPVYLAPSEVLKKLFSVPGESTIRIGHLLGRPDVEVRVNVNSFSKHLLVTGTTGSGKSNAVAVLADRVAALGGTVIIFDVHGEYVNLRPLERGVRVRVLDYKLNPLRVPTTTLARMVIVEPGATRQRAILIRALNRVKDHFSSIVKQYGVTREACEELRTKLHPKLHNHREPTAQEDEVHCGAVDVDEDLVKLFKQFLLSELEDRKGVDVKRVEQVKDKVDEFFEYVSMSFKALQALEVLEPSTVVVLNVSGLGEEERDYSVKLVLDELLWYAKQRLLSGSPHPILVFIEEAHLFLSQGRATASRHSIERVAREGRKFGVALALVSQRPRNIDPNAASQVQNHLFLRLIQESDQLAVMNISDMLTEDLARSLASMDVGEAVVIGEWIGRLPAFVKLDKHVGKGGGTSLDMVSLWKALLKARSVDVELAQASKQLYNEIDELTRI